ncbi:hypothetical protein BD289DRAFT_479867 [Coniella lustricola]|uniref:Uncharacterized protein n=1 Tax=Coniella lustricola TaxID=2025994 RepID=A0A2T3AHQ6_9PEZI|nr:hypothetical protein BD289DRAFT_479867 [Coniella lustricola]
MSPSSLIFPIRCPSCDYSITTTRAEDHRQNDNNSRGSRDTSIALRATGDPRCFRAFMRIASPTALPIPRTTTTKSTSFIQTTKKTNWEQTEAWKRVYPPFSVSVRKPSPVCSSRRSGISNGSSEKDDTSSSDNQYCILMRHDSSDGEERCRWRRFLLDRNRALQQKNAFLDKIRGVNRTKPNSLTKEDAASRDNGRYVRQHRRQETDRQDVPGREQFIICDRCQKPPTTCPASTSYLYPLFRGTVRGYA